MAKAPRMDAETAEVLALAALAFLAEDPARLTRFLSLTGMEPGELRAAAGSVATLAAVLEHMLADESMLLAFAANRAIEPTAVGSAHALLSSGGRGGP